MIELRGWQQEALEEFEAIFKSGKDAATIASAPASGKTIFSCSVIDDCMNLYGFTQIIIVSPTENIRDNWQEDLSRFGYQLKTKGLRTELDRDYNDFHGMSLTYSYAANHFENLNLLCKKSTIVVFDEAHHMGDSIDSTWGNKCKFAFNDCGFKLLLTGTPWRTNGEPIPFANYDINGFCIPDFRYSIGDAVADHVCQRPEIILRDSGINFVKSGKKFDFESLEDAKKENKEDQHYSALIRDKDTFSELFREADNKLSEIRMNKHVDAGGIIIARSKTTAHMYADILKASFNYTAEIVHSDMNNAKEKIKRFKKSTDKWIISVDMIGEGTDIPRLEVELYMSAKKATICLHQYWMRPARIRSKETDDIEHCYIYCLDHSKLRRVAKEIEDDINFKIKEKEEYIKPPEPKKPIEDGEGFIDRPPVPNDDFFILGSDIGDKTIACAGEHYNSDEVMAAESYLSKMKIKIPTSAVCSLLRLVKKGEVIDRQEEIDNTPLEIKKEEVRKRLNSAVNNMAFSLAKREGYKKPEKEHFRKIRKSVNSKFNIHSVDNATYEELKEMLEYIATLYTEVA